MDLEVPEAILLEELERDLHPTDGWDLSAELDKARVLVDRVNGERAAKAEQLSQWVLRISIVLLDLGMLPIQDIPQLPNQLGKSCWRLISFWNACEKHWPSAPVHGIEFVIATSPVTLGRLPHRSSAFFFILPLRTAVKYVLMYIHTLKHIYI
jgi:hypothetical protein